MGVTIITAIILILSGALFLFKSILIASKVKEEVPKEVEKEWRASTYLMGFFLIGYLFVIGVLVLNILIPLEIITGVVFLGGGFFVYIINNLSRKTIQTIAAQEADLWLTKEKLRQKTGEPQP